MEDFPVDVCISYSDSEGVRQKHYFTSSVAVLRTLHEWKQLGLQEILLTWGRTRPIAVEEVSRQILLAEIACMGVQPPGSTRSRLHPREARQLTLGELASLLGCLATLVSGIVSVLFAVGQGAPGLAVLILIASAIGFMYSAAMAVLFRVVRRLFAEAE